VAAALPDAGKMVINNLSGPVSMNQDFPQDTRNQQGRVGHGGF
jgi:hypothetical protein